MTIERAEWTLMLKEGLKGGPKTEEWALLFCENALPIAMAKSEYGFTMWSIPILYLFGEVSSISDAMAACHSELVAAGFEHLIDPPPKVTA